MSVFIEGNNKFLVNDTPKGLVLNFLNPYHPLTTMVVTIEYPVLPSVKEKEKEAPIIEVQEVIDYLPEYREFFEEETELYHLFRVLLRVATHMVSFEIVGDEEIYRYLVALYAGHLFEMHLRDLKDEANRASMNEEVKEKNYHIDSLEQIGTPSLKKELFGTVKGIRFYNIFAPMAINHFRGVIINGKLKNR